ncbi:hypothetical protein PGTUg99_018143 [Puccinia graminis f. sp. tritici]|uniref:Uncharacterized protein n=1 Tax=Puccinia graminis f. sp. tritici TaxID=56615 RepID=A0A5B0M6P8_PUCGR|nr:hypothetical protein PGTUg99_018143 [Puccinia graminis f. sp. tritici]
MTAPSTSREVERRLRPQLRALSSWCLVPVQGEAFSPDFPSPHASRQPVSVSIPIPPTRSSTDSKFRHLPASSIGSSTPRQCFTSLFLPPTESSTVIGQDRPIAGCSASRSRFRGIRSIVLDPLSVEVIDVKKINKEPSRYGIPSSSDVIETDNLSLKQPSR